MATLTTERTVGEIVTERPARARLFERYGIDYCCGGKISLEKACARKKLDPSAILSEIARYDEETHGEEQTDWSKATLSDLADHIVSVHHDYLREELPRLQFLTTKVARVHGDAHPELPLVRQIFEGLKGELESHMRKEENVLFPVCKELDKEDGPAEFHFGSVGNPIRVMEHEHDDTGQALERMSQLTNGYEPPLGACNSYRAMLDGLKTLEEDLHLHIHKENSILFPRAAEAERKRREKAARE